MSDLKHEWTLLIIDERKIDRKEMMDLPWGCVMDLTAYGKLKMNDEEIKQDILEEVMPFIEEYTKDS